MNRDDILDAAAQVIRKKGFHAASMADIAETVKLQKASLYHHVSSKQEILLALLDRAIEMLTEQIAPIATRPSPADEKLREMTRVYLRLLAENADLASVLLFEHRSLEPKQHTRHIPNRDKFEALWRDVVSEGVASGTFHCPDSALTVRGLLGLLNWTVTWYRPKGELSIQDIADQYVDLLYHGLLTSK
ncbi:MAG: TetR/AcrR family transcriptional regulator [Anaerolineaceae bacterium]|nr:MAG: TetR/AcrR family transcriptional regulator [Anaerolineaceae bacterium]